MYPIKLVAETKAFIWGGDKLKKDYNKISNSDIIAESWEVSCHQEGLSRIENGEFANKTLSDVLKDHPEYLGENAKAFEFFPILVKLIDAKENLSIQVHPSDEFALKYESQYGKSEMWYVVDVEEGAGLYCGFNKVYTMQEIEDALKNGKILDLLNHIKVKKGDVVYIPAGTIHAICGGLLICEIQQNSAITYRLFDYNRVDKNGNQRQLHIDKALQVIDPNMISSANSTVKKITKNVKELCNCKYFKATEIKVDNCINITMDSNSFATITCVEGEGEIAFDSELEIIKKGDTYFIPASDKAYTLYGTLTVIEARV